MEIGGQPWLVAVMGPTGSGKSELAEELAAVLDARLVNADAFQVYRGLDIGTNKPSNRDAYELLDLKDPWESFGVGEYVVEAAEVLRRLYDQGRSAVVVGGTGFYVRALFEEFTDLQPAPEVELRQELMAREADLGLQALVSQLVEIVPDSADTTDLQNPVRVRRALERALSPIPPISFELPPYRKLKLAIRVEKASLDRRINERARSMLHGGWIAEVEKLLECGIQVEMPGMRAIGYIDVAQLVVGATDAVTTLNRIQAKTRQYAKRQVSWLRSEPGLKWLDSEGETEGIPKIRAALDLLTREEQQENG